MSESVVVPRSRRALVVALALLAGTAAVSRVAHARSADTRAVRQDFNGDGYEDPATGAPGATVGGRKSAGYVAVVYGSAHGLNLASRKVFTQATAGVPGSLAAGHAFGAHLAAGDLDGDGYTDLVVPAAGEGSVTVLWGGARGLSPSRAPPARTPTPVRCGPSAPPRRASPPRGPSPSAPGHSARIRSSPVWAPSSPADRSPRPIDDRSTTTQRRTARAGGLAAAVSVIAAVVTPTVAHAADTRPPATRLQDDFNGDGRAELAVGAPGENAGQGAVWVFKATASGITPAGSFSFGAGTPGTVASGARLGSGFDH